MAASKNAKGLAVALAGLDPADRLLGAEINSIRSMRAYGYLDANEYVRFLVSDTENGRLTGQILKFYYRRHQNPYRFREVDIRVIEDLRDDDVGRFKNQGLRNLVRLIADTVRYFGVERVLINATGGYKAQISFAGMIGMALGLPVYYLFERFSQVIELPPQPVAWDLSLWLENTALFYELDEGLLTGDPGFVIDGRLTALVDRIEEDGRFLVLLSAAGQLFHTAFRFRFQRQ